eukprot:2611048-Rhodomonas_salina.1
MGAAMYHTELLYGMCQCKKLRRRGTKECRTIGSTSPTVLRIRCAMFGTNVSYATARKVDPHEIPKWRRCIPTLSFAFAIQCAVLTANAATRRLQTVVNHWSFELFITLCVLTLSFAVGSADIDV